MEKEKSLPKISNAAPIAKLQNTLETRETPSGAKNLREWIESAKFEYGIKKANVDDLKKLAATLTADRYNSKGLSKVCGFYRIKDIEQYIIRGGSKEIVSSLAAASKKLGVTAYEIKKVLKNGCPAYKAGTGINLGILRDWLEESKKLKEEDRKADEEKEESESQIESILPISGTNVKREKIKGLEGGAHALTRLQTLESELYTRYLDSTKLRDGEERSLSLKEYLEVSRALLGYEKSITESKRAAGEILTRQEAIDGIKALVAWLQQGISGMLHEVCPLLTKTDSARKVAEIITPSLRQSIGYATKIGTRAGLITPWMSEALNEELKSFDIIFPDCDVIVNKVC